MESKIASPIDVDLEVGETYLSIKEVDGNIFVVDQNDKLINGLINCSATTDKDEFTTINLTCYAHKRSVK